MVATAWSEPPSRHEIDDLFSVTMAAALESEVLVVCGQVPPDALPLEIFENLVADARGGGTKTIVDLSPPRLNSALVGRPRLRQAERLAARRVHRGPRDGARADQGGRTPRAGCRRRLRDGHAGRRPGADHDQREDLGTGSAALQPRCARGERRLDGRGARGDARAGHELRGRAALGLRRRRYELLAPRSRHGLTRRGRRPAAPRRAARARPRATRSTARPRAAGRPRPRGSRPARRSKPSPGAGARGRPPRAA